MMNRIRLPVQPMFQPRLAGMVMLLALVVSPSRAGAQTTDLLCGVDISSLTQAEAAGGEFYDFDGTPVDPLAFLRAQGVEAVRLRVWHSPEGDINGLDETLALARRAADHELTLLLNLHYSDIWADPGQQTKPAAWTDLSFDELTDAVYAYTAEVVGALAAQGTPPAIVQLGNEITGGMLWEDGRVSGDRGWPALRALLAAGGRGVRDGLGSIDAEIMLHIDPGEGTAAAQWFFDHLGDAVDFDLIGLSYYPWWQGDLETFSATLRALAERYGKPLIVVETAYPWTLDWADQTHNPVGEMRQLLPDIPASPQGQAAFLSRLADVLHAVPDGLGRGYFYWEPSAIPAPGWGSSWENLAGFDFDGRALPALRAFGIC